MKKKLLILLLFHFSFFMQGQVIEKQTTEGNKYVDSIPSIIPVDRQSLLSNVDVIFNSRFAYDSHYSSLQEEPEGKEGHQYSSFNINQLRFEIKGKIHDKVYFRFRHRFTKDDDIGSIDHMSQATDMAFARIDLGPRTNFSFGKLCADWGGYEFDFNPIDILAYNDIVEFADNYLVGAGVSHTLENKKHSFTFQVLNSRTKTFEEVYGTSAPAGLEASEYPLAFVVNWRGSFGKFETTYSYSYFNEAVGAHMNYIVLGNKFKFNDKFVMYYDFHYSDEGLDRTSIVSSIVSTPLADPIAVRGALYVEDWLRAEYFVSPKVNLLLTAMHSNHYWKDNPDPAADDLLSISYGLIPTVQYFPFKEYNMKFYLSYIYRKYDYKSYAEEAYGVKDYTTGLLSFGIIAPFLVL